tara:strand:- start:1699 stop:2961 length:1263 start_codon:yes stop_codon:yes gene_type:complete
MNKIEKIVYDLLKENPKVKLFVRNWYQRAFDLLPNRKDFSVNDIDFKKGYFFGFHDVSPFSIDNKLLLANKLLLTDKIQMPKKTDLLEVGYFDFDGGIGEYHKIGESAAWNYHKGCRLQWLPDNKIIYNIHNNSKLSSIIYDFKNKSNKEVDFPIDSVSKDGNYATNFSYERLQELMPGYGYIYQDNGCLAENTPKETGLFIVDLKLNERKLVVSLFDLSRLGDIDKEHLNKRHYVTHTLYSSDSKYIAFLHRWIGEDVKKRWSRLIVYDIMNDSFSIAPTNDMVSHYVWNDKNQIIAYCRVGDIDAHYLFLDHTLQEYNIVAYPEINSDGHQSFIRSDCFITDTYPDKYRMAKLFSVNIDSNEVKLLANLNSLKKYQTIDPRNHWACDFHPRMDSQGKYVCFDSVHTGERSICVMKIDS